MSLRESKICFCQINLCAHYLYGPYENVNFMVTNVYLLGWEWRKQKTYDSIFNYYCMICPSTIVDYLLGEYGAMRCWYYSYILATHTRQKHKSETSLSKIAILADRKTNHYYPNNQTVSSMIPIMLSKTPSPQVLVRQFKPNLHLFTTF